MYLERIKICNFRCFGNEGIEAYFNMGVNSIIGENNVGKTALIDAIRIGLSTMQYQRDIYFKESDFHVDLSGMISSEAQFDFYFADVPMLLYEIWMPDSNNHGEFHIRFYKTKTAAGIEKIRYNSWGGSVEGNKVSPEMFDSIDLSYLGALRDAEDSLRPSRNSRLATLLHTVANSSEKRVELVNVLKEANDRLLEKDSIGKIKEIINKNLDSIEQEIMSQRIDIGFTEPQFDAISSSIRSWVSKKWIQINKSEELIAFERTSELYKKAIYSSCIEVYDDYCLIDIPAFIKIAHDNHDCIEEIEKAIGGHTTGFELRQNGLGYNNLIFMSTILGDMSVKKDGVYHKLLLVEEPEAHLHPQLQELIYSFFLKQQNEKNIQIIFTSHSPTLVSRINLDQINLLFDKNHYICCLPMSKCKTVSMPNERKHIQKYLDVTRAQLFFAKGLIFVEGISEALLIPEMAKLINRPLNKYAVEVINVNGLAFRPFIHLLYSDDRLPSFCKAAIITDDDRCTKKGNEYYISTEIDYNDDSDCIKRIMEKIDKGNASDRYLSIQEVCSEAGIELCGAKKTLEYELAFSKKNVDVITGILKDKYSVEGGKLQERINQCASINEMQVVLWLFIRSKDHCKAELAQSICDHIMENDFDVPEYLKRAIYYVTEPLSEVI